MKAWDLAEETARDLLFDPALDLPPMNRMALKLADAALYLDVELRRRPDGLFDAICLADDYTVMRDEVLEYGVSARTVYDLVRHRYLEPLGRDEFYRPTIYKPVRTF